MARTVSSALVFALSLSIGAGCAAHADDDVASGDSAQTADVLARSYEGTIGNLKIVMRVDTNGSSVTGSYFYADKVGNGDRLVLKGTASGGKLSLTESVNGAGPTTGTFAGSITAQGVTGTWKSGTKTLPLALTAIKAPKTVIHKIKDTAKSAYGQRDCSLEAELVEVYGLANQQAEAAINEALTVEGIERDANGKCDGDIRYVTQSVALSTADFITVHVNTEYDGGAHPEISSEYFDFVAATGGRLTAKDFFVAGSASKVKDLVVRGINADPELDADGKRESLETLDNYLNADTNLEELQFAVTKTGLKLDMLSNYPHVIAAIAPVVDMKWADLRSFMKTDSPVLSLSR